MPPDEWDDSKSTLQQESVDKSKAPSSPVSDDNIVTKQHWWKRLLRRRNGR
ncbi:hypothetical protein E8E11_008634 [Didymella keratinophila]|nr:hypothetical protein E8E11_008634 [Didymella keratinophila]